jgi:hypothetical protein
VKFFHHFSPKISPVTERLTRLRPFSKLLWLLLKQSIRTLLHSASRRVKDCFEWHQEAVQDRDTAHCLLQAKQHEFEVIYSELAQRREALTLFQQQLLQHAHRHIRTIQAKPDGDLDHFKSVTISLQAQLTRREENIADLRLANATLKQEIAQARTDMELALEIATTQLEAAA